MKRIITIQHTESEHHLNGMVGSWTDWELSKRGRHEAQQITTNLTNEFDLNDFMIYSSDLKRAVQTAQPLATKLGKEIMLEKRLRERNLGECCGQSVAWLNQHKLKDEETIDDRLFPSAESRRESFMRLKSFFDELIENPKDVVLVAHGDILTQFYALFLNQKMEILTTLRFQGLAGGVSVFITGYWFLFIFPKLIHL
uniref:histidine phosphatase family protein n=1 Tax=Candidatus Enterococcus willemsii TaxID=1857215 RepID=UPI00403FB73F